MSAVIGGPSGKRLVSQPDPNWKAPMTTALPSYTTSGDTTRKPQESAAAQAAQAAQTVTAAKKAAADERNKYFCRLKSVCEKYGAARQTCATAGNFGNCIVVKLG